MKLTKSLCLTPIFIAGALLAQGPPRGGRPFGPRFEEQAGIPGRSAGILGAGPGSRTLVTGAPYSATETLQRQQTLANGNQIATKEQSTVYRDSQGRIRTEETITPSASSGSAPYTTVTIFDPVGGYRYVLNSATMTAYQSPLPKPRPARGGATSNNQGPPAGQNLAQANLGTQSINGVAATGTQLTETIPAGAIGNTQPIQVTRTSWISTDLKVPVQIRTSDPRYGITDMELTNIVEAEPGATLFVVPAGYTVQQGGGPGGPRGAGRRGPGPR